MSIDVVNLFRFYASVSNCCSDAGSRSFAGRVRSGDMICVAVHSKACQLSIDVCATSFSMLQLFKNQNACTFTHYKAITLFIERARCCFRVFVVGRQSLHVSKACDSNRRNCCFGAACQHYVSITVLNGAQSVADAVGAGSTCSYNSGVRTFQTGCNSNLACRHVRDFHRNEERADFGRAFGTQLQGLLQEGVDAADTAANANAATQRIFLAHIQLSIFDSQLSSSNCKVGYTVHTLAFFFINESSVIKILNLTGNLYCEISSIKLSDRTDTGFTGNQVIPEGILADTDRSYRANASYYNSSFTQNSSPRNQIFEISSFMRLKISFTGSISLIFHILAPVKTRPVSTSPCCARVSALIMQKL